ncbi:DUF2599 domain-containing protein [Mycobacterium camsae]|uniref:DUF2599 domain-containing protein n=1 Tax=Mycobacterium gordonae TaxID=1778 RepID=UPI00197EAC8A|nr:DUF2599 domain-containing protein [Mycobacterium gordonae]
MRFVFIAPAAALISLLGAVPAAAGPGGDVASGATPPFVDHTAWAVWGVRSSLRVYPTSSGRAAARASGTAGAYPQAADEAWSEVLARAPDADTPGMRAQFVCHWQFAEIAEPGKTSWNLEPWRPVVDDSEMIASRCNPGASEEPF